MQLLIARLYVEGLINSRPFHITYVEEAYCTVDSDSSVGWRLKPDGLLSAFQQE